MPPKTSRDLPGPEPRKDTEREDERARIADAANNDGEDRDRVHGDGDRIGLKRD
ncbi:MAG: hypothetical protein J0G34_06180 [Afipia sp.]|nr:hypothetical protein [Afipia sp.]